MDHPDDRPILSLEEAFRIHPQVRYTWPEHGRVVGTVSQRQADGSFLHYPAARKRSLQIRIDRQMEWATRKSAAKKAWTQTVASELQYLVPGQEV